MSVSPWIRAGILCIALALCTAAASAQLKLGIIDTQKAMLDTIELKAAQKEMEAKFKPRQDRLEQLTKEIAGVQQQLQTLAGKLNAQGEADLVAQGQRKQREAERLRQDLQEEVDRERQDVLSRSSQRMKDVIQKLAEAKGLDVVIDVSNAIYSKPALDITAEATAAYDKAYPGK